MKVELKLGSKIEEVDKYKKIIKGFKKFQDGYYELISVDNRWWEYLDCSSEIDRVIREAWEEIVNDDLKFEGALDVIEKMIMGATIDTEDFYKEVANDK